MTETELNRITVRLIMAAAELQGYTSAACCFQPYHSNKGEYMDGMKRRVNAVSDSHKAWLEAMTDGS